MTFKETTLREDFLYTTRPVGVIATCLKRGPTLQDGLLIEMEA